MDLSMRCHDDNRMLVSVFVLALLAPAVVLANAGSPIMWFSLVHLVFINAAIGVFEAKISEKIIGRSVPLWKILVANYVSMYFGYYFIAPSSATFFGYKDFWGAQTAYGDYQFMGLTIGLFAAFLITVVIEYPFYWWATRKPREALRVMLVANLVSYVVMFAAYAVIVAASSKL